MGRWQEGVEDVNLDLHRVIERYKDIETIGFAGPGIALIALTMSRSPVTASAWLTLAIGLKSFSHFGFLVNLQEIAPQYSGVLHGLSNTAGTFAAIVCFLLIMLNAMLLFYAYANVTFFIFQFLVFTMTIKDDVISMQYFFHLVYIGDLGTLSQSTECWPHSGEIIFVSVWSTTLIFIFECQ
ncbi:hypothetical protein POM88_023831 [Heracleum sosnowskyi]|uniref:Uncharacterized protein n=1 Tax=Heracleum sosnowskyi TaxID=360622 RepID=A0AAD8IJL5_9APIA|nr:hypothetical protein POM88_023831 [Heracleum sosnowskyi]